MQRPINTRMDKLWNTDTMEYHLAVRITDQQLCTTTRMRDFPGGPEVKNLPCNAGDASAISGQGTKIPHATEQRSLCTPTPEPMGYKYQALLPQLQSPRAHNKRST